MSGFATHRMRQKRVLRTGGSPLHGVQSPERDAECGLSVRKGLPEAHSDQLLHEPCRKRLINAEAQRP
jgi:hypothetical protein